MASETGHGLCGATKPGVASERKRMTEADILAMKGPGAEGDAP